MMWTYRLVFDIGDSVTITAKSRKKAIEAYCEATGMSFEWIVEHCRIINCGRADR